MIDAHAELDCALIQYLDQPTARIAAIKQHISWGQLIEVLEQELPFTAFVDAVLGGGEHQIRPRQEQAEQNLIGKGGAFDGWNVDRSEPSMHRWRQAASRASAARNNPAQRAQ